MTRRELTAVALAAVIAGCGRSDVAPVRRRRRHRPRARQVVYYGGRGRRTHRHTMTAPIPPRPALHPDSDSFRAQVLTTARTRGGWALSLSKWTCPVYFADASTRRITVGPIRYRPDDAHRYLHGVPMPRHAVPDPGDFHLAVYDLEHGIGFEFFGWKEDPHYMCRQACQLPLFDSDGWAPHGWGATDSGASASTGIIWPHELVAGVIPHALKGPIGEVDPDYTILPATNASGVRRGAPPYGIRMQLDPGLDLDELRFFGDPACRPDGSLKPWQKTIARCLQVYGWYVSDQGGVSLGGVNTIAFRTNPYRAIPEFEADATEEYMPVGLIEHFRFLDGTHVSRAADREGSRIPDLHRRGAATWSAHP